MGSCNLKKTFYLIMMNPPKKVWIKSLLAASDANALPFVSVSSCMLFPLAIWFIGTACFCGGFFNPKLSKSIFSLDDASAHISGIFCKCMKSQPEFLQKQKKEIHEHGKTYHCRCWLLLFRRHVLWRLCGGCWRHWRHWACWCRCLKQILLTHAEPETRNVAENQGNNQWLNYAGTENSSKTSKSRKNLNHDSSKSINWASAWKLHKKILPTALQKDHYSKK